MNIKLIEALLSGLLCLPFVAQAGAFDNTLWLGNNKTASLGVLNVTRDGKILRQVRNTEATGIAIDATKNRIYFGTDVGNITGRDLNSPAVPRVAFNSPVTVANDMAFDGKYIWRTDTGNREVQKIDPATGAVVFSFTPSVYVIGIAWDGQNLWLSEYNGWVGGERIMQFTSQGAPTGVEFSLPYTAGDLVGGASF